MITRNRAGLSSSAAARWLGISKSTLLRAVRDGRLPFTYQTPGGHLRFALNDLERFRRVAMARAGSAR